MNKTSRLEGSTLHKNNISVSFYFHRGLEIILKVHTLFDQLFYITFLICLLNVNFQSIVILTIISSSLNRIHLLLLLIIAPFTHTITLTLTRIYDVIFKKKTFRFLKPGSSSVPKSSILPLVIHNLFPLE